MYTVFVRFLLSRILKWKFSSARLFIWCHIVYFVTWTTGFVNKHLFVRFCSQKQIRHWYIKKKRIRHWYFRRPNNRMFKQQQMLCCTIQYLRWKFSYKNEWEQKNVQNRTKISCADRPQKFGTTAHMNCHQKQSGKVSRFKVCPAF